MSGNKIDVHNIRIMECPYFKIKDFLSHLDSRGILKKIDVGSDIFRSQIFQPAHVIYCLSSYPNLPI